MQKEPISNLEALFEKASDYAETRYELFKLNATKTSSDMVSTLASKLILLLIVAIFTMILNIGIALLLGELMGKLYYGFFTLAGFYLIAGIIFNAFKNKWIKVPLTNYIIKKIYG
jgi:hypothetical protein